MSQLRELLCIRDVRGSSEPCQGDSTLRSLSDLKPGDRAVIAGVCSEAEPSVARRLFDLGYAPGSDVECIRRAPFKGPVVFRIAGYELALRPAQARCIKIENER